MPKGLQGFQKGHPLYNNTLKKWWQDGGIPWNKGLKMSDDFREKCRQHLSKQRNCPEFLEKRLLNLPSGEKHYNWNGGLRNRKRDNERNDSAYHGWIKQVKKRDKNTCKIKNKDCSGHNIVHHILPWRDFPELRYNINNGITLCQAHHPKKRAEEKRLIPMFQGLVPVSNEII